MRSLKNSLLFLVLLWTSAYGAEAPTYLVKEESILEEFRGQIRSKFEELSQNYIISRSAAGIVWSSSEKVDCAGITRAARYPLASISMSKNGDSVSFIVKGCNSLPLFKETFETQNAANFTLAEYLSGQIPSGKLARYLLQDGKGQNVFEWHSKNSTSVFLFASQRFLDIYKEDSRWQYKAVGYSANYSNDGYNMGVVMDFDDSRLSVDWSDREVRLYNTDYQRISVNSFLTSYSHAVQSTTLNFVAGIVKYFIGALPSTEFVAAGGQNSRFLDEMRLTYTRLLNNLELNLVKQYIQEVIKAIESGLIKITDNRPEEE